MNSNVKRMGLLLAVTLLMLFGTLNYALAWTLSGTVYGGSNPLAGATVTLKNAATSAQVGTTATNAGGVYSFTVPDASYNLTITPSGAGGFSESVVNGITVSGSNVTQNVVLVSQARVLSGVVKNSAGVGAKNIQVTATDQASGVVAGTAWTDANGSYSVALASGTYKIDLYGGVYAHGSCGVNGADASCPANIPTPQIFYGYGITPGCRPWVQQFSLFCRQPHPSGR
jgi:hypothetical protein